MKYIVAYDIAHPKRLQKVARLLEKHALRCQKSVFIMDATKSELVRLLDQLALLIEPRHDVVQAWKLASDQKPVGEVRGTPSPVRPAGFISAEGTTVFISEEER